MAGTNVLRKKIGERCVREFEAEDESCGKCHLDASLGITLSHNHDADMQQLSSCRIDKEEIGICFIGSMRALNKTNFILVLVKDSLDCRNDVCAQVVSGTERRELN